MARYSGGGYRGGSSGGSSGGGRSYGSSSSRSSGSGRPSGGSYGAASSGRSSSGYSGGRSAQGRRASSGAGRSSGKPYAAITKSFIAGKIAGQYQAKGYSTAHAQNIGNKVVRKMSGTFQPGRGSKRSYTAGVVTGRNQGLHGYGLSRSTYIGNAVVRKQAAVRGQSALSQAQIPLSLTRRSKVLKFVARNAGALQLPMPTRQLRDRSKIRYFEQVDFEEPDLSMPVAGLPSKTTAPAQPVQKIVGLASAASPALAGTAVLESKIRRLVDLPPQNNSYVGSVRMGKIAGWADPSDADDWPNATVDVSVSTVEEDLMADPDLLGDEADEGVAADTEAPLNPAVTRLVDATSGAGVEYGPSSTDIEESDVSFEAVGPDNAAQPDAGVGTFNQRILDEIANLTPRAIKVDAKYKYSFDISETEFEGVKFLIDYARGRETLDYFEIVTQLLALKRRAPEDLGVTRSAYIDALIEFVRAIVEAA